MSDFDVINKMLLCDYEYFKDKTITQNLFLTRIWPKSKLFTNVFTKIQGH